MSNIVGVAAKIPWKQVVAYLPEVAKAAQGIRAQWDSKPKPAPIDPTASVAAQVSAVAERVQVLEDSEKNQSEVVSQIAEQLEGLAGGLRETAARQTVILRLCIGSLALAACALVVAVVAAV